MINIELVTFKSTDGFELNGALKKGKHKNNKLIIHLHGMTGNFYGGEMTQELINGFTNTNFDILSINNRGHEITSRIYSKKNKMLAGTAFEIFEDCIKDIDGAIKIGKKLGYKKFILSGHSTGCQKVTYYQSKKINNGVIALILLAPADDYTSTKIGLGKRFDKSVEIAKKLVAKGEGDKLLPIWISRYSAKRYLSYTDSKNTESQLFNYNGRLKHFSNIQVPILAVFGENDKYLTGPAKETFLKLKKVTKSILLETIIIKNTDHPFRQKEKELVNTIKQFLKLL